MTRAIITDLDRTLLRTDKTVSDFSVRILGACRARGIPVMAATARPARAIADYLKKIPFDAVTTLNGAVVILPGDTVSIGIPKSDVLHFLTEMTGARDTVISLETDSGIFANTDIPLWQPMVYPDLQNAPLPDHIYKILLSSESCRLSDILPDILPENTYFTVADRKLYQIMHTDATKRNGIMRMLQAFGLSPEDAVYFGDDNDDIESVRMCGTGVAVSNAIPQVLAAADAVADSNDEDGVARYIEKMILSGC